MYASKDHHDDERSLTMFHRTLLPRLQDKDPSLQELILFDFDNLTVTFRPFLPGKNSTSLTREDLPIYYPKVEQYSFKLFHTLNYANQDSQNKDHTGKIQMFAKEITCRNGSITDEDTMRSSAKHLPRISARLLKKLNSWCNGEMKPGGYIPLNLHDKIFSKDEYQMQYSKLKEKYKDWVKIWPEKTDAIKFVFEDIAIAAYLICLWSLADKKPQDFNAKHRYKFVDLGCGNGFLVYILNQEGYPGYGVDLQKRAIWDIFAEKSDKKVDLRNTVIEDPRNVVFEDVEWIIGNHSDELTPWIPIIARNSSNNCKFWILPCCFYQLDGKFTGNPAKKSRTLEDNSQCSICSLDAVLGGRYRAYLDYVREIAETCGFIVLRDAVRIPSTKNICFASLERDSNWSSNITQERISHILMHTKPFVPRNPPRNGSTSSSRHS